MENFYIKNYGCQMNAYDTEKIAAMLTRRGYERVYDFKNAFITILYTCNIRDKAIQKVYSDIGKLKLIKNKTNILIAIGGCMSQQLGDEILKHADVDIIFGSQNIQNLPEMIDECIKNNKKVVNTDFLVEKKFGFLNGNFPRANVSSFLTIQEGCDNFCTYCVVPFTRGREISRPSSDILLEAEKLVQNGAKEIILLGQNVNAYNDPLQKAKRLEDLIYELDKIEGLERINFMSSNPQNMTKNLIDAFADIKKLTPFLHLPVQSGSNNILKKMNRPYTVEEYIEIINNLKSKCPDIAISSDFIVGFPSETDKDFELTIDLVKNIKFSNGFYFKYSRRPGTIADKMPDQVPEHIKDERFAVLDTEMKNLMLEFNKSKINNLEEVLFEDKCEELLCFFGKTRNNISCCAKIRPDYKSEIIGKIRKVYIKNAGLKTISGEVC